MFQHLKHALWLHRVLIVTAVVYWLAGYSYLGLIEYSGLINQQSRIAHHVVLQEFLLFMLLFPFYGHDRLFIKGTVYQILFFPPACARPSNT